MNSRYVRAPILPTVLLTILAHAPLLISEERTAFVTSERGTGDLSTWPSAGGLSGLAAADKVCQTAADSAGLTGTSSDGLADSNHCDNWFETSADARVGFANHSNSAWTSSSASGCTVHSSLYCLSEAVSLLRDGFESGDLAAWVGE